MTANDRAGWDPDAVLAASNRWAWVPPGAPHVWTDELLVVAYPVWFSTPTGARVFRTDRTPAEVVDEIVDIARGFGRDRLWWQVSDTQQPPGLEEELVRRGSQVVERMDILGLPIGDGLPDLEVPAGIEVRRVSNLATKRDAHLVERSAFGEQEQTDEQLAQGLGELVAGLADDSAGQVVAYVDGEPAGLGGWTMDGPVCRLWGGGTYESRRGRGAYRAVLAERLRLARAAGATLGLTHGRVDTSSPILRRIGFTRYGEQRQLVLDL